MNSEQRAEMDHLKPLATISSSTYYLRYFDKSFTRRFIPYGHEPFFSVLSLKHAKSISAVPKTLNNA